MLRSNLATRPFYNDRAVYLVLGVVAVVGLVVKWQAAGGISHRAATSYRCGPQAEVGQRPDQARL